MERKTWRRFVGEDIVVFSFQKKTSPEIRRMIGTHNLNLIPKEQKEFSNKAIKKVNDNIVKIFDLEKNEWRSFDIASLIEIDYTIPLELFYELGSHWFLERFQLECEQQKYLNLRRVLNNKIRSIRRKLKLKNKVLKR